MRFKYTTEYATDETEKQVPVSRPKIEVILRKFSEHPNPETNPEFRVYGLVDSGADVSFIPRQIAEILKLDLEEDKKKKSKSASEEFWTFRTTVYLEIMYQKRRVPVDTIQVAVPEKYEIGGDIEKKILLGRNGLFDKYEITFNERVKGMLFRKIQEQKVKRF